MTAPPDRCPLCLSGPFPPDHTKRRRGSLTGHYWCLKCGRGWVCSWLLSALKEAEAA